MLCTFDGPVFASDFSQNSTQRGDSVPVKAVPLCHLSYSRWLLLWLIKRIIKEGGKWSVRVAATSLLYEMRKAPRLLHFKEKIIIWVHLTQATLILLTQRKVSETDFFTPRLLTSLQLTPLEIFLWTNKKKYDFMINPMTSFFSRSLSVFSWVLIFPDDVSLWCNCPKIWKK